MSSKKSSSSKDSLLQKCVLAYGTAKGTAFHKMSAVLVYLADVLEEDATCFEANGEPYAVLDVSDIRYRLLEAATYAPFTPVPNYTSDDEDVCGEVAD